MNAFNKKLISGVVAATLALSAGAALAKGGERGGQYDPASRLNYIFTQLSLTEDQQAQVIATMTELREAQQAAMKETRDAMRNSETQPSDDERLAMQEAHRSAQKQALTDALNQILSPADTEELVEYLDAHQQHGKQGKHGGKGGKGGKGEMRNGPNGKGPQGQPGAAPTADAV